MGTARIFKRISEILSICIFLGGMVVLIGWISDTAVLKSISPNFVTMKANTAICFILIGMSLWLLQTKWQENQAARIISGFSALVVFMIGFLTLCEYSFGWNFGIDQLLFKESAASILTSSPGRMAFNTSIIFVIISITLFLYIFEVVCLFYVAQSLAIIAGIFSFLSFSGYLYGASPLYITLKFSTAMAVHTSILFMMSCIGCLFIRPEQGLMKNFSSDNYGSIMMRRILPIVIVVPLALGFFKIHAGKAGWFSNELGLSLVTVGNIVSVIVFIYILSIYLNRLDTKRKQVEDTLRVEQKNLKAIFASSPVGMLLLDDETMIVDANTVISEMVLRDLGYVIGQRGGGGLGCIHSFENEKGCGFGMACPDCPLRNAICQVLASGASVHGAEIQPTLLINGQQQQPWLSVSAEPVIINDHKHVIITIDNITERKQAEEEVQIQRQNLANIIEGTHVGTWEWNVQTGKTLFNERWAEIIGYKLEELAPISIETWLNLAHPDDIKTAEIMLQKHFLGELDYYDNECRMKHKNGSWVWVHDRGKVVEWTPDGRPLRMYGTHGDITERKQAENKINTSQKLLQRIIDLLPIRVFWKDNNLRFLGCNEILVKDAGANSPEDLIGKDDFQMSWKEQAEMYQEDDKSVMNSGKSKLNIEELQTTPKGDKIWLKTSKVPLTDLQGNTIGLLGIYEDITERKQAEQEKKNNELLLRQSQKMEAIGTLAGGIAHDFNNILGSIIGYADLVKDDISEGTIAYQNQKEVLIAAKRAKELVKQILTFSRKDAANLVPVKINAIVADSLKMLRASLPTTIEISHDINCTNSIMANETHIHQVLMNLCVNASHAMEDNGGILQISLSDMNIDLDTMTSDGNLKQGSYVKLLVKDTGSGMSREVQERIFEPFFTTKEVGKGTGMGLSVVHGIVENHNGIITVDSKLGEGTTFEIFFPCVVDIEIKENEDSEIAFGNRERILLVDDQKNLVDMATQMLTRMGYEVVGKTDSVEALCIFREDPSKFDLVITDQIMPKMKGTELAKELLNIRPDIPIVLCTGYCENIDSAVIDAIGIKMLVMKPVDRIKISRIIREILDKNMIRKGQQYETHSCYR